MAVGLILDFKGGTLDQDDQILGEDGPRRKGAARRALPPGGRDRRRQDLAFQELVPSRRAGLSLRAGGIGWCLGEFQ